MKKVSKVRQLALSLLSGLVVAGTSAGLVYAWSNAQGKVRGIGITVGSTGILVNGSQEWSANVNFSNILPGWTSEPILMSVENISEGMNLALMSKILFTGTDFTSLANTMLMAIEEVGSNEAPDYQTLSWWSTVGKTLSGGSLLQGTTRNYQISFKLPATAGDEIQNKELGLSVLLTGTQAP